MERAPYVVVLGIAQDGGYPQAGCGRNCCKKAWADPSLRRRVTALGLIDPMSGGRWLFEATPDLREQLQHMLAESELWESAAESELRSDFAKDLAGNAFESRSPASHSSRPHPVSGVFLTHAHIGHYAGLMQLGREAMGARRVPTYVMPLFAHYLAENGPWDQLVSLGNIELRTLEDGRPVELTPHLVVEPLVVPHRGEYSETVGFRIRGPQRTLFFLPDIDQWDDWHVPLLELVESHDALLLDGTFFDEHELPTRDRREIPHPPIVETIDRLTPLAVEARAKVRFVHLNHTNPALDPESQASRTVYAHGFRIAEEGERIVL